MELNGLLGKAIEREPGSVSAFRNQSESAVPFERGLVMVILSEVNTTCAIWNATRALSIGYCRRGPDLFSYPILNQGSRPIGQHIPQDILFLPRFLRIISDRGLDLALTPALLSRMFETLPFNDNDRHLIDISRRIQGLLLAIVSRVLSGCVGCTWAYNRPG